jgi:hypothetical protein
MDVTPHQDGIDEVRYEGLHGRRRSPFPRSSCRPSRHPAASPISHPSFTESSSGAVSFGPEEGHHP